MARTIRRKKFLAQALRRQPWNDTEKAAGGVVEANPKAYTDRVEGRIHWLEHRQFWTTNVSLLLSKPSPRSSAGKSAVGL